MMERLTFEGNFCDIAQCKEIPCPYNGACSARKVWERLKEYEDTKLEPAMCANYKTFEDEAISKGVTFKRIVALMEADKAGRLVVLPCKDWLEVVFGDQVLFWGIDKEYVEQPIREISLDDADRVDKIPQEPGQLSVVLDVGPEDGLGVLRKIVLALALRSRPPLGG
jgi:hypothetical protein